MRFRARGIHIIFAQKRENMRVFPFSGKQSTNDCSLERDPARNLRLRAGVPPAASLFEKRLGEKL